MQGRVPPVPSARLKRWVLLAMVGAAVLSVLLFLGVREVFLAWWQRPSVRREEPAPPKPPALPDVLTKKVAVAADHGGLAKKTDAIPVATPVTKTPATGIQSPRADPPPPAAAQHWQDTGMPDWFKAWLGQQRSQSQPQPDPLTQGQPGARTKETTSHEPKQRQAWRINPTDITIKGTEPKKELGKEEMVKQGAAANIIKPATWARPVSPLLTLYRSMTLAGKLLDNINSDIPSSTIRVELTQPVLDKFYHAYTILPQGSLVIVKQEGKTEFAQSRLLVKLEQIELPGGEIIELKAHVGDEHGAGGVPGKVNAHTGKLLLATGINAILQIGVGTATGTPQGFYQNPGQRAAQDAGQSVAQDINSYTRQVLRVPPTIEVKSGQKVTISLEENLQFNRKPYLAR